MEFGIFNLMGSRADALSNGRLMLAMTWASISLAGVTER